MNVELLRDLLKKQFENVIIGSKLSNKDLIIISKNVEKSIFRNRACVEWKKMHRKSGEAVMRHRGPFKNVSYLLYKNFVDPSVSHDSVYTTCGNAGCVNIGHLDSTRKKKVKITHATKENPIVVEFD
jgi:hypothetical protein